MGSELLWLLGGGLLGSAATIYGQRRRLSPAQPLDEAKEPGIDDRLAYYQALELAQFKGGFLARTAHELRSPLSSLMGLHQLILTDLCDSPEEERECLAQAYEAAQNFLGLLESVIEVSKFDAGSRQLKLQPCSLEGLLADVEMAVALPLGDRNIRLTLPQLDLKRSDSKQPELEPPQPEQPQLEPPKSERPQSKLWIRADYDCLRQVLTQLLLLTAELNPSAIALTLETSAPPVLAQLGKAQGNQQSHQPSHQPSHQQSIQRENGGDRLMLSLSHDGDVAAWKEDLEDWQRLQQQNPAPPTQDLRHQWRPQRFSRSFSLFLQQCLLELMDGRLELSEDGALRCSLIRSPSI